MDLSRNQVIEAGAGTGKTYSLVQALLQALFQKGIPLTEQVALTFTKKAAGEMRERVATELENILSAETMPEPYRLWGRRLDDLKSMARTALDQIDRANISTIHSFAFSLLKRFPLAAGIDPASEVDEKGLRYADIFDREWPRWLSRELQSNSAHAAQWLEILSKLSLNDIHDTALRLCDFDVPLWALPISDDDIAVRLKPLHEEVRALAARGGKDQKGRLAAACEEILAHASAGARDKLEHLSPAVRLDSRLDAGSENKTWSKSDVRRLKELKSVAQNCLAGGDRIIALLTHRLKPFIGRFRSKVLAEGYLSNNALLALACELVRRHHDIRAQLKEEFRMIFIDEFQDTDPLQGELLLFLSEKISGHAARWTEVELEPGKLFVVGDPKQSIYRFRGADIRAYRQITELIIAQGGMSTPLQKSYRSHDQIIHVVNHAFSQIIQENKQISPPYTPLEPLRIRDGLALQDVELRLIHPAEAIRSEEATAREAADIATWIGVHVGTLDAQDKKEGRRPLKYRDIALVFRSTPAMRAFVEALREATIPFVVEGERYFYSTPEVTDLINFLRVIDNPRDALALVGFLRSPLGGFTDRDILTLKRAAGFDASRPLPPAFSEAQQKTWKLLEHLHTRVGREPLKTLLNHLFEESFILELAARSYHHDQTVANILKLKRLLESFAEESAITLRGLLGRVQSFMDDDRLEGESPLADDSYDAVRLLTIHKAKGLEFPVVILPSLHAGRRTGQSETIAYDWSSNRLGVRAGTLQNVDKFFLDWDAQEREREEEKRVLYVAMTRARERLILSGGTNLLRPASDSYLEWLRNAWNLDWNSLASGEMALGPTTLHVIRIPDALDNMSSRASPPAASRFQAVSPAVFAELWDTRQKEEQQILQTPRILTPSLLLSRQSAKERGKPSPRQDLFSPTMLGTLVHRFLEHWDFTEKKGSMPAFLWIIANNYFADQGLLSVALADDSMAPLPALVLEAQALLTHFIGSDAYEEIKGSKILGREIPFFYATDEGGLLRGTMDILYRLPDGQLVVGDYKTDQLAEGKTLEAQAKAYEIQSAAYRTAIQRALGENPLLKLIFLRAGWVAAVK